MTNCPNCGAPYKPGIPVCEYCGTPHEKSPDEIRMARELEQAREDVERAKQNLSLLQLEAAQREQYNINVGNGNVIINSIIGSNNNVSIKSIQSMRKTVTPYLSQQAACGVQALANAASNMTCSLEQARLNAEQARVSDVELRQTVALQQRMQAVRSDIMRQKHSEEQFYSQLLCFVILTFLLPLAIPICLILSIKTAIVAKLLGMFLIPTWFCLGYIISLRGMKRYKGSRR